MALHTFADPATGARQSVHAGSEKQARAILGDELGAILYEMGELTQPQARRRGLTKAMHLYVLVSVAQV